MARDDRREGEVAVSRERLTDIAAELARRAQPEYVKARAQEVADDLKVKAQVAAREKVDEFKDRARAKAMGKVEDVKESVMREGKGMSWLGAAIGAGLGVAVAKFFQDRRERVEYRGFGPYAGYREIGYGFEGSDIEGEMDLRDRAGAVKRQAVDKFGDLKEQASGKIDDVKTRASDAFDSARESVSDVKERISTQAHELAERVPSADELKTRVSGYVEDDPIIVGLGALAFGAIAGLMLPVSDAERKAYSKVRLAAQEKLQEASGMIHDKLEGVAEQMEGAGEKVRGAADIIGKPRSTDVGSSLSGSRGDQELTAEDSGVEASGEEGEVAPKPQDEGFANHPHTSDDLPSVH